VIFDSIYIAICDVKFRSFYLIMVCIHVSAINLQRSANYF
jgi:hypothetical protein